MRPRERIVSALVAEPDDDRPAAVTWSADRVIEEMRQRGFSNAEIAAELRLMLEELRFQLLSSQEDRAQNAAAPVTVH